MSFLWNCSNSYMSVLFWGSQSWTCYSRWHFVRWSKEGELSSMTCWLHFFHAAEDMMAFWASSALCRFVHNFSSLNIPKSFSVGLLSISYSPSLYRYWGLPDPGSGPWNWPCWTSWGLHQPAPQTCQDSSGQHPFTQVNQLHHSTCVTCKLVKGALHFATYDIDENI